MLEIAGVGEHLHLHVRRRQSVGPLAHDLDKDARTLISLLQLIALTCVATAVVFQHSVTNTEGRLRVL